MIRLFWIVVTIFLLTSCGKVVKEEAFAEGSVVLALGDSLTAGAGVTPQQAWPALLAERTGWVVINGGESGDKSDDALKRLPSLLKAHDPVLVLVTLGGNDMLRHIAEQETVDNLGEIFELVQAHGAEPVLLATPKPSLARAVFQNLSAPKFYRKVAEKYQVHLIEDAVAEVISDPDLKGDPLHPNAEGHMLLSDKIFSDLQKIGFVR
ncbi:MAG: GDSL-type esterase/lipase family protein [Gallionella sp.]